MGKLKKKKEEEEKEEGENEDRETFWFYFQASINPFKRSKGSCHWILKWEGDLAMCGYKRIKVLFVSKFLTFNFSDIYLFWVTCFLNLSCDNFILIEKVKKNNLHLS